ncbi:MAG: ABC transporter ATP-binding protein [Clostridiales bacterium]|nr:ABC transporter ATP-binding protein [Clostridiales bacterium]
MDNTLLMGQNLVREYGTEVITRALDDVSVKLNVKEFASIIGQSGSGKSTLLNMLGALDRPTSGKLLFRDKDLSGMNDLEMAQFRNRNIGFIFQFHHLLPEFTALENVLLPTWIESGKADRKREARAMELLELVGLKDRMKNMATNLSGGQQQRVSIARALINDPNLVLADEPTGNLDSDSTDQVYELLRNINRDLGMSFLIVTHDRHIAEKSDRVIEMKDGRIINDYKTKDRLPEDLWECLAPNNCKHRRTA